MADSPFASLTRRGSVVVISFRLRSAFLVSAFLGRGVGKWRVIFVCYANCLLVGLRSVHVNAPDMDCCSGDLHRAIGEGVFGMVI